jgi:broad specificity phosphatase PhoE
MTASAKFFLIRHAETDSAGTFCGHSDPPINTRGRLQIEALLNALQQYSIEAVHSSDLQRARSTAEVIAENFDVPLRSTSNLREIGFGDWENLTWEQIERHDPIFAKRWSAEFPSLASPNGEELADFEDRVLREFDTLATTNHNAAVVTHGGVLRVILTRRCGVSDDQAWLHTKDYCSVFIYPDGGPEL